MIDFRLGFALLNVALKFTEMVRHDRFSPRLYAVERYPGIYLALLEGDLIFRICWAEPDLNLAPEKKKVY